MNINGKKEITAKSFFIQNFVWLAGIIMAVVNLWLVAKLAPLTQNVVGLDIRVSAVEQTDKRLNSSLDSLDDDIKTLIREVGSLKQYCHP